MEERQIMTKLEINMKEIMKMIWKMGLGRIFGNQEIFIREGTKMMKGMDMVKCIGLMAQTIKECGIKVFNMVKVVWNFLMAL